MKILEKMQLRKFLKGGSGLKKIGGVGGGDFFPRGGFPPLPRFTRMLIDATSMYVQGDPEFSTHFNFEYLWLQWVWEFFFAVCRIRQRIIIIPLFLVPNSKCFITVGRDMETISDACFFLFRIGNRLV